MSRYLVRSVFLKNLLTLLFLADKKLKIRDPLKKERNRFRQILTYKAEEAGRKLRVVNPAYTIQTCYQYGHMEKKMLSEGIHRYSKCGYTAGRDLNAAQNILTLGMDGLGAIPRSLPL